MLKNFYYNFAILFSSKLKSKLKKKFFSYVANNKLDKKLKKYDIINFHPLENTSTINMSVIDFLNFMFEYKKLVKFINFDNYTIEDE